MSGIYEAFVLEYKRNSLLFFLFFLFFGGMVVVVVVVVVVVGGGGGGGGGGGNDILLLVQRVHIECCRLGISQWVTLTFNFVLVKSRIISRWAR